MGDPVELGLVYQNQGADELVFLDISATNEGRKTMVEVVENVAAQLMIPFTVGGGISSVEQAARLLEAGADKVSINTAAVLDPQLIRSISEAHGSQSCVVAIDARQRAGGGSWDVLTHGGRKNTGLDALRWAEQAVALGAGEILLTSWDRDGTLAGFDILLTRSFTDHLPVPVIASGGAANPESFVEVFSAGAADAALAATIFHDGSWTVDRLKSELKSKGIRVRL
jgi:cyclase